MSSTHRVHPQAMRVPGEDEVGINVIITYTSNVSHVHVF